MKNIFILSVMNYNLNNKIVSIESTFRIFVRFKNVLQSIFTEIFFLQKLGSQIFFRLKIFYKYKTIKKLQFKVNN